MSETVSILGDDGSNSRVTETRLSTLETLAELNNEGASHLENSRYSEAISTFAFALTIAMKDETEMGLQLRASGGEGFASASIGNSPLFEAAAAYETRGSYQESRTRQGVTASDQNHQEHVKSKKLRRRKQKRRNSMGSTGTGGKESSVTRLSRRERRRRERHDHHQHRTTTTKSRRARSAMGRLSITHGETMVLGCTEDVEQVPQKYIHSKPLRLWDRYNLPSGMELAIYLVYNLALAQHLQAVKLASLLGSPMKQGVSMWSRIIQLYKLTTCLVEQQHQRLEEETIDDDDDVVVDPRSPLWSPTYTLALPNNLACAYHSSGNDSNADETWQQVLSHIWCLLDLGCTSQVDCFSQLLENAAHLMDPNPVGRTATAA